MALTGVGIHSVAKTTQWATQRILHKTVKKTSAEFQLGCLYVIQHNLGYQSTFAVKLRATCAINTGNDDLWQS